MLYLSFFVTKPLSGLEMLQSFFFLLKRKPNKKIV